MRVSSGRGFAYPKTGNPSRFVIGWLQAGFSSFAYRLAHLLVPRLAVTAGLVLTFYLV